VFDQDQFSVKAHQFKSNDQQEELMQTPDYVTNTKLIRWVEGLATLCRPGQVYWCDGSQ